jgi:hypothetical protein
LRDFLNCVKVTQLLDENGCGNAVQALRSFVFRTKNLNDGTLFVMVA